MRGANVGETPERMTGFSIIRAISAIRGSISFCVDLFCSAVWSNLGNS
jgi:hypothetical protein